MLKRYLLRVRHIQPGTNRILFMDRDFFFYGSVMSAYRKRKDASDVVKMFVVDRTKERVILYWGEVH